MNVFDGRMPGGKNAVWKLTVDFKMPSGKPALGVELMRVDVNRQHCTLRPVPSGELNQLSCAGTISDCFCISVTSSLPCSCLAVASTPFCLPLSSSRLPSPPDEDGDGDGDSGCHQRHGCCYCYPGCCHHRRHTSRRQLLHRRPGALPLLLHGGPCRLQSSTTTPLQRTLRRHCRR